MSIVADAAHPSAQAASPVRHGLCRLTLRIGGTDYTAQALPARSQCPRGLVAATDKPHSISAFVVAAPKGEPARTRARTMSNRAGRASTTFGALLALGLLRSAQVRLRQEQEAACQECPPGDGRSKSIPKEARQHLAEIAPPAPAPCAARRMAARR